MAKHLLEVKDLRTSFFTPEGEVKSVDGVSYYVEEGEAIAIVGESGCGKSVTQMSVMQLVQCPPGKILSGEVLFDGQNLLEYKSDSKEMRSIRGSGISMIFQEPMTSLNPVLTVGAQLCDIIITHNPGMKKDEAWAKGTQALKDVGIPEAEARMKNYPFEMSGGMRQRVMIAAAIVCGSKLIIADEPTTALDVTTQAQVMDKMRREELNDMLFGNQDKNIKSILTKDERDVIWLVYGFGKEGRQSNKQIEEITGIPKHQIAKILAAAQKKIKDEIERRNSPAVGIAKMKSVGRPEKKQDYLYENILSLEEMEYVQITLADYFKEGFLD